jgi:Methyltransferase domain
VASTAVCLMASRDEGYKPGIICIEPHPTDFLIKANVLKDIQLIRRKLQDVYSECPEWLRKDDLFLVDSSHTLGPAGEVSRIILEILPNLPRECHVHFHDIWLPYDYSPRVLDEALFFWHETALLCAFLCMNQQFRIEASLSMLHHQAEAELRRCLPSYAPAKFADGLYSGEGHYPSSIYLRS